RRRRRGGKRLARNVPCSISDTAFPIGRRWFSSPLRIVRLSSPVLVGRPCERNDCHDCLHVPAQADGAAAKNPRAPPRREIENPAASRRARYTNATTR